MVLNLPTQKKESLHVEVLSKMKKLRILYIGNRSVRKSPKLCPALPGVAWLGDASELMLPNDLRLLEWCGYPFKSLPLGFQPNNLIELNMPGSHIEQLWSNDPIESLGNLKRLDLSECKSLTEKLNLTITPNLESLHLEDKAHDLVCKVIYGSSMPPRIPDWFSNRSCSPSITIERHPDLNDNWKVMGYALLLVHETDDCVKGSPSIRFDFETDEGPLRTRPLVLYLDVKSNFSSTWVYIPANWFLAVGVKNVNGWSYLKVSVRSSLMVKECGARLVHEHDAKEFYDSITSMYPLGSLDSELLHHLYSYSEMDCYPDVGHFLIGGVCQVVMMKMHELLAPAQARRSTRVLDLPRPLKKNDGLVVLQL
ncbi:putative WRKY transcription factor 19 [Morella rubra]|uniref:Putative WRKY transcription factor 19 n=1 Tax=Morella rubra TaxID=262757 RepID=A0A6A1WRI6_9ROSI|nr:putative WRKY transcription factor 19 [Morella rubra]